MNPKLNKRDLDVIKVADLDSLVVNPTISQRYEISPLENEKFTVELALLPKASDVLLVSLHGGVSMGMERLPRFEWMRTLAERPESQLYISDPTLTLNDRLLNGWYVGDDAEDLTPRLAAIVEEVAAQTNSKHIVLLGSSSGGFAAARIGHLVSDSVALAFSTQRNLGFGPVIHVPDFFRFVFPLDSGYGEVHERIGSRVSIEETLSRNPGVRFVWVQNSGDVEHMRDHFLPFSKADSSGSDSEVFGENVHLVEKYYGPGHPVPPLKLFNASIDACIDFARSDRFAGIDWMDHAHNPPADAPLSDEVLKPSLNLPLVGVKHRAGSIEFAGTATPGDVVALKIGSSIYQSVNVKQDGSWAIDQSFAPAPAWDVCIFSYRQGVGVSEGAVMALCVVSDG